MELKPEPPAVAVPEAVQPKPTPVMDVVAPPPPAEPAPKPDNISAITPNQAEPTPTQVTSKAPQKPGLPKQPGNGMTAVIVATVIIVLVLSGLAVYAYLQSSK